MTRRVMKGGARRLLAVLLCVAAVLAVLPAAVLPAAAQTNVVVQPESRMWIDGHATVGDFTCQAEVVDGHGRLQRATNARRVASEGAGPAVEPEVTLVVPVASFDCGKRPMNRDLYEALQAERHPVIRYELDGVEVLGAPEGGEDAPYRLRATGRLTLAGQTRHFSTELQGERLGDGRLRAWGAQPIRMTDFGVKPPTALMGLIRTEDRVVVRFDLVAAPEAVSATY